MKISIIKYGMGNVASVQKALNKLGYISLITNSYDDIRKSDFIILPGVGSFSVAMDNLNNLGLTSLIKKQVISDKKPFLGICLGMQLMATFGNEPSKIKGLDLIAGEVVKINSEQKLRVPHLGWNNVCSCRHKQFYQEFNELDYYFIHSYHFVPKHQEDIVLTTEYGETIVAAIQRDNIYGTQFHPEKSQEAGMKLLKNIIDQYA